MKHLTIGLIAFLLLGGIVAANDAAKPPAAEAVVTEVGQWRTPCFGTCPVYAVTINRDGTFKYHGTEFVNHKGDWTGHLEDAILTAIDHATWDKPKE